MSTTVRLGAFLVTLGLLFGAAWWAGTLTGTPTLLAPPATTSDPHAGDAATGAGVPLELNSAGLVATAAGFTLVPRGSTTFQPGVPAEFAFVVTGPGGRPVTAFDPKDERLLDLVVVRRDGAGFQHLEPLIGADGVWRAPLTLPDAGVYRAYADFVPTGGPPLVLGTELSVPGDFAPVAFPPSYIARVADYEVRLDADLVAGSTSRVFVSIGRDRLPVRDFEPYLGAPGHLVVLRQSDLAYLRVAPEPPPAEPAVEPAAAPAHRTGVGLTFLVDVPAAGGHRLFFEFRHEGVVHTAEFTARTGNDR